MPTLTIKGKDVQVGDDFMSLPQDQRDKTIDEIASKIPDEASGAGIAADMAQSFGRGVVKGGAATAGSLGDVREALPSVGRAALGAVPVVGALSKFAPTTPQIEGAIESVSGPFEQAKSRPGRYLESVGEQVVPTAIGGGEGLLQRGVSALASGVLGEAGSEIMGAPGRFIGTFLGGSTTGLVGAEAKSLQLSNLLPSKDSIKKAAQAAYKMIEDSRLIAHDGAVNRLVSSTRAGLDNSLATDVNAPGSYKALQQLQDSGGDVAQIMAVRQRLGENIKPSAGTDYMASLRVKDAIDDWIANLPDTEIAGFTPPPGGSMTGAGGYVQDLLNTARGNWKSYAKLDQVETAAEIGRHIASSTGVGQNTINAMRQRVRQILDSESKVRGFSDEAKAKMEDIVEGTWLTNSARYASKWAPSSPVSAIGTMAAFFGGGPTAAAAVGTAGVLTKYLGDYLTKRQIRELEDIIRGESPLGRGTAAQIKAQAPQFAPIVPTAAARAAVSTNAASPLGAGPLASQYP